MQIKIFLLLFLTTPLQAWFFYQPAPEKPFSMIIEASGDAQVMGRTIHNSFESALCFSVAQKIRSCLLAYQPTAKIILNRTIGQTVAPLQNANLANKLNVDLYISISAYQEIEAKPRITLYQFSYKNSQIIKKESLAFFTFDTIYNLNFETTTAWIQLLHHGLLANSLFDISGPYQLPFKPLIGIQSPAIAIELGIPKDFDLDLFINPLVHHILPLLDTRGKQ
jgi:N-acetylmuramoyl-L-alanine amidase